VRFIESLRRLSGQGGLPFTKLIQEIVRGSRAICWEVGQERYRIEPDAGLIAAYDARRELSHNPFRAACYAPYSSMYFTTRVVRICCHNWKFSVGVITKNTLDESGRAKR
jgi:hypothetical protein